jgi:protein tyrosine phosphatase
MTVNGHLQQRLKSLFPNSRLCFVCLVILLIGGGIWVWEGIIKDRVIPKRFGVVQEGQIYRSGCLSAALVKKVLKKYNIKVIIDLTVDSPDNHDQKAEKQAAAELGIERLTFPLRGNGTGDIKNYARAIASIVKAKQERKPVLVHCAAGTQRTGGVIAAYRLLVEQKDISFIYAELMRYDWDPKDDTALLKYLNSHMAELATLLKQMLIINEIPDPLPALESPHKSSLGTERQSEHHKDVFIRLIEIECV